MQRVFSAILVVFGSLGALHAGQEDFMDNRAAGASAPKPPAVGAPSAGAKTPNLPPASASRSAKIKGRPDATDHSFTIWPPRTQLGTFSADTEHGRLTCTSHGTRTCRWE
jgi:hypothetical protein